MPPTVALGIALAALSSAPPDAAPPLPPDHAAKMARGLDLFRAEIAPLLKERCLTCHGGEKRKGEFDLSTRAGFLRGGESGPAVALWKSADSKLHKMLAATEEPAMPPSAE